MQTTDPFNPGEAEKGGLRPCNLNITGVIHKIDGVYRNKIAKSNGCLNEDEKKEYNFMYYVGATGTRHGIYNFAGCVAVTMFIVLALGGLETVRRALFEWFYKSHVIATVVCFFALAFHYEYGGLDDASPVIVVLVDYAWRFWLCKSGDATVEDVEVTSMSGAGGDIIKLTLSHPVMRITEPGQYCFMRIGQLGHYQWHPFSIMSTPGFSDRNHGKFVIYMYIRDFGSWTQELIELGPTLLRSSSQQEAAGTTNSRGETVPRVSIDGMYGRITVPFETYPSLIITCDGCIGCTPMFSVLMHLAEQPPGRRPDHVCFVWSVRERELLRCFEPELARCRDIGWDIRVHLTSTKQSVGTAAGATEHEMETLVQKSEGEQRTGPGSEVLEVEFVLSGRPDLPEIFSSVQQRMTRLYGRKPTACAVLTCGPRALVNGTKAACVKSAGNVTFEFHSEEFEW